MCSLLDFWLSDIIKTPTSISSSLPRNSEGGSWKEDGHGCHNHHLLPKSQECLEEWLKTEQLFSFLEPLNKATELILTNQSISLVLVVPGYISLIESLHERLFQLQKTCPSNCSNTLIKLFLNLSTYVQHYSTLLNPHVLYLMIKTKQEIISSFKEAKAFTSDGQYTDQDNNNEGYSSKERHQRWPLQKKLNHSQLASGRNTEHIYWCAPCKHVFFCRLIYPKLHLELAKLRSLRVLEVLLTSILSQRLIEFHQSCPTLFFVLLFSINHHLFLSYSFQSILIFFQLAMAEQCLNSYVAQNTKPPHPPVWSLYRQGGSCGSQHKQRKVSSGLLLG
ncbi:uncharacterized protein VP01_191g4 [Puccinia sorghi]|uniref:Uncharacterized protein n=1 Tax=Puccinia sorghi TaxID=27349 RepID=A0A0L6VEG4_9BASI|nr:uncharacterized protein VP01_191g4 [Puccinia sorghi]